MVDGNHNILYLNPLTLEAQWFLNTLTTYGQSHQQIDQNLCKTLNNIMGAIERFLDAKPEPILPTEKTKFVDLNELQQIKRSFMCSACNYKTIGHSVAHAALHLAHKHDKASVEKKKIEDKGIVEKKKRVEDVKKKMPANIKLPKKAKSFILNAQDLETFFRVNLPINTKLKQLPEYDQIEEELLKLVRSKFTDKAVRLFKFGSRFCGIGTPNSDLDIFIDIGNTFNIFQNRASETTVANLQLVRKAISTCDKWKLIASIEGARVPIIKVTHIETGIDVDLGFSNSLGYCNTKLADYLFELQPVARYMCIFLKKWLERVKMCEHISTYTMTLMVIYFLQLKKILPSIEKLQTDLDKKIVVGPWIGNFATKTINDFKMKSVDATFKVVRQYLKEFFEYYSHFKYDVNVVCPYFGLGKIEIKTIEKAMPKHYSDYVAANKDCGLQLKKPMVVQDPIQLNHNVTKAITPFLLQQFVEYCHQSAEIIPAKTVT